MTLAEHVIREDMVSFTVKGGVLAAEYFSWRGEYHWKVKLHRGWLQCQRRSPQTGCAWRAVEREEVPPEVLARIVRALREMDMMSHTLRVLCDARR